MATRPVKRAPVDQVLIRKEGENWKIIVVDANGKEHKVPQSFPNWRNAGNKIPFITLTDRGYKVKLPDSTLAVD